MNNVMTPAFAAAVVKTQGEIEGAVKGKANPAFRSKYADLGACWDACRDALQSNQIAVLQFPTEAPAGYVGMATYLVYGPSGEVFGERFSMPLKDPTNAQAAGSAITYARRYALCSVIGICPEDDDGIKASAPEARRAPKTAPEPNLTTEQHWAKFQADTLDGIDQAKTYYSKVKASTLAEPAKTELLAKMATVIKGMK